MNRGTEYVYKVISVFKYISILPNSFKYMVFILHSGLSSCELKVPCSYKENFQVVIKREEKENNI